MRSRNPLKDRPEKTCPVCGQYCPRRRGGCCTHCGTILYSYRVSDGEGGKKTIWITEEPSVKELCEYVEHNVRQHTGLGEFQFTEWKRELGMSRVLLERCELSQHLAFMVVDAMFDKEIRHEIGIYSVPRSVSGIVAKAASERLDLAMAWAKKRRRQLDDTVREAGKQMEIG